MNPYLLEREQIIPQPRSETFAFFCEALNLERITPPFLRFRVLARSPIEMKTGALLEYRLALFGIPFNWLTLIESWEPDEFFTDVQLKGPYSLWRHTHEFEEIGPRETLMRDRVEYRLPYGMIGRLAHVLFVKSALKRIFDYRAKMTAQLLAETMNDER